MSGDGSFLPWLLLGSIPLGLVLAGDRARGRFREKAAKVPPGNPA